MLSNLHNSRGASGTGAGKGKVGNPPPKPGRIGVKVKAAIFFDGTGNNQSNITKRLRDSAYPNNSKHASDYESYDSFYSNVAVLYFMHVLKVAGEHIASVYMEGIGTSNDGPDDTSGGGFGAGPTGVVARVNRGISDLGDRVRALVRGAGKGTYLQELTVYVFGFSRGAAAARHFCARRQVPLIGHQSLSTELRVEASIIKLKFVGLFDTVSSFDATGEATPATPSDTSYLAKALRHGGWIGGDREFRNDVAELHLNLDDPSLEHVVHLVAADEYRFNFSSTNIASAIQTGKGYEIHLPGAHSDIGGGYKHVATEDHEYNTSLAAAVHFFDAGGWYAPGQLTRRPRSSSVYGKRSIFNSYQFVGLFIMIKLSRKVGSGIKFGDANQQGQRNLQYTIDKNSQLGKVQKQLESYALAHFGAHSVTAPLSEPDYHWLRGHFLHLSWRNKLGFELRLNTAKIPERLPITG